MRICSVEPEMRRRISEQRHLFSRLPPDRGRAAKLVRVALVLRTRRLLAFEIEAGVRVVHLGCRPLRIPRFASDRITFIGKNRRRCSCLPRSSDRDMRQVLMIAKYFRGTRRVRAVR